MADLYTPNSFRVPPVPGVYCKTSGAQPTFLSWNRFYATLRKFSGEWSCLWKGTSYYAQSAPG
ncbi:MAG TPA: hypothetical protein VGE97_03280 [Nitrososphaera sp.]